MKRIKTKEPINLATCANPYNLVLKGRTATYTFYGTVTLGGNFTIAASGTPTPDMNCLMLFNSAITVGGNTLSVLGTTIPARVAISPFIALAKYDLHTTAWIVVYQNFVMGKADGTTLQDSGGVLSVKTIGDAQFSTVNGERLTYAKMNLLASILVADLTSAFQLPVANIEDLTASEMVITGAGKKLESAPVATYPSLAELALVKGLSTTPLQDQLDAIVATFGDYTTSTALAALFTSYYTSSQTNSAISAAIATLIPIKDIATLATSTDLSTVSPVHQEYLLNATAGAVDIILPLASSVALNTPLRLTLYGVANASDVSPKGTDTIIDMDVNLAAVLSLTAVGSFIQLISNGTNAWKVIDKKL
jgi:hypothetical protein